MRQHGNTLYITTQGAYLSRSHATLQVKIDGQSKLAVPLLHLDGVVCFGRVSVSPGVYEALPEHAISITFLTEHGRFLGRVERPVEGNVLLRRQQYRLADDPARCLSLARPMIAAKIQNSRIVLLRAARDCDDEVRTETLRRATTHMAAVLADLPAVKTLDAARGIEGETARTYFGVFQAMIGQQGEYFQFRGRTRRPPLDPVNALLSFLYALVRHDCESALSSVGLDPAVGYLHVARSGRCSLALDLMEEFRTLVADRVALAVINRRQVQPDGFTVDEGGAYSLTDAGRRKVLTAYQERKREEVTHPILEEAMPIGLLPLVQARLLARTLRGDLTDYPALVLR